MLDFKRMGYQSSKDDVLKDELLKLCDEFTEFNDYCAFFCDSVGLYASQSSVLDGSSAFGMKRFSHCIKDRSREFNDRLQAIMKKV